MRRAVLGIDLGTGSVKAAIVDAETGEIIAAGSAEHPTLYPEPNAAEQSPNDWWHGTISAVNQARAIAGYDVGIERIGVTGQMHGTVLLDRDHNPIGDAIIWSDTRSAATAQMLMSQAGTEILEIAGSPVAAGFQAATLRWLRDHYPERMEKARLVLTPKDYLRLRLTGTISTDPGDAAGTLLSSRLTRHWSPRLLELAEIRQDLLPQIRPSSDMAGALNIDAAQHLGLTPGTPVATGAADAAAAALGAGVIRDDQLLITLSTGAQVLVPRSTPDFDAQGRLHTFASALEPSATSTGWYIMGATMVAGMALRWLRDSVFAGELTYEQMTERSTTVPVGSNRLLFLPHMAGERSPQLNPLARGSFIGLTPAHNRADLTRAVLEGVVFSIYDAYLAVREVVNQPAKEIVLAGGGARSPLWRSMIADLFNLPVRPLETSEQTVIGAAILAQSNPDHSAVARRWATYGAPIEPDLHSHREYLKLFEIYTEANRSLFNTFSKLASVPSPVAPGEGGATAPDGGVR